jgi:formylglycine-generating enzyme required for sulfatase activity
VIGVAVLALLALAWHAAGGLGQPGGGGAVSAGDSNGDGSVNISDALHLLNFLFASGPPPATCQTDGGLAATEVSFDTTDTNLSGQTVQSALQEVDESLEALSLAGSSLGIRVTALEGEVEIALVAIPPGSFVMGSPPSEAQRRDDEMQHLVHITKGFLMGGTEVTQDQFHAVMGWNPSLFSGCSACPVDSVNWYDAREFCRRLTDRHRLEGKISESAFYRLPTEAEWEYACRAGTTTRYFFGDALECAEEAPCALADEYMWWIGNNTTANFGPKPVASKQPNPWGLYDMHGNVTEWCQDVYGPYAEGEVTDPTGATEGRNRSARGGSWNQNFGFQRSAGWRFTDAPERRDRGNGLRVVLEAPE